MNWRSCIPHYSNGYKGIFSYIKNYGIILWTDEMISRIIATLLISKIPHKYWSLKKRVQWMASINAPTEPGQIFRILKSFKKSFCDEI